MLLIGRLIQPKYSSPPMLMPMAATSLPLNRLLLVSSLMLAMPRPVAMKSWLFDSLPAGVVATLIA
ncbi:hypothetical protein D3C75_1049150 [compost metagenome]